MKYSWSFNAVGNLYLRLGNFSLGNSSGSKKCNPSFNTSYLQLNPLFVIISRILMGISLYTPGPNETPGSRPKANKIVLKKKHWCILTLPTPNNSTVSNSNFVLSILIPHQNDHKKSVITGGGKLDFWICHFFIN